LYRENALLRHGEGTSSGSFDFAPIILFRPARLHALRSGRQGFGGFLTGIS